MKTHCLIRLSGPLVVTLLLAACGGDGGGSSSASGAGGDASSASGSGGAGSTANTGGAGSTANTGGAGGKAGSGGAGGGSGNAKYSAYLWLGGLDHMILWKADETNNLCFTVYLNSPEQNSPSFNVTLPMSWGVSNAVVSDNAMDCAPNQPPMGQTFAASSGMGTIAWMLDPGKYYPCAVDFHLDLVFAGAPAWAPPAESLDADGVTLIGGCP